MIRLVARPRGKLLVDVAVRTGAALSLAGNVTLTADEWDALKVTLERGRAGSQTVEIAEHKEEG